MIVKDAREVARRWVVDEASKQSGYRGALHHGSTNWLPDDALLSATSDVDVMVVLDGSRPAGKGGKFVYRDVILDVSYLPSDRLRSPALILGDYHLAGSFRTHGIISDPSGELTKLQAAVSEGYSKRQWVYARCEHARSNALRYLDSLNESRPLHDQVIAWLFGSGVIAHVLLVAGLKNPTVRRRYVEVRGLLAEYDRPDLYHALLELLGCAGMSRERVEHHLAALAEAFDAAKGMVKTPFPFAPDITDLARPIAIEGSRELIERGYHREAVFWIVVTYSRVQIVLFHDASTEMQERFSHGYRRLLGDLDIASFADLRRRRERAKALLPRVWETAEAIMAANPGIEE